MSELDAAIVAWRKTKHPRFAVLAELATERALAHTPRAELPTTVRAADLRLWNDTFAANDPLDLPRLFAPLRVGKNSVIAVDQLSLLARRNDPRLVTAVLALLEAPPYRSRTALPFFRICAELLSASGDPRAKPALESLSGRYKGIIESSMGIDVSQLFGRTAKSMVPIALDESMAAQADALEAAFPDEMRARRSAAATRLDSLKNDEALIAAILAAPHDDTPRLVYADALAEREDPRAELITLQVARARGPVSDAHYLREVELLADPKRRALWALPLSQGGDCWLERGFATRLVVDAKGLKNVVGSQFLRLLETVEGLSQNLPVRAATALLNSPDLRVATHIGGLTVGQLETIEGDVPWPSVAIHRVEPGLSFSKLTAVRRLSIPWVDDGLSLAALPNLEHLRLVQPVHATSLETALAGVTMLRSLSIEIDGGSHGAATLRSLPHLKSLAVGSPRREVLNTEWARGLQLEDLEVDRGDPAALIDALPMLKRFTVRGHWALPFLGSYLGASRRNLERVVFGPLSLETPFTANGVARLASDFQLTTTRDALLDAVALLTDDCVQRIEVRPPFDDPHKPLYEPIVKLIEGLCRMRAKVPVVLRWQ